MWLPGAATVLAIVSCYGTAAAVTLLGISMAIDERVWAGVITLFTALAAVAIAVSYSHHRKVGPIALAGMGLALILWAMYGSYSRGVELAGFALLAAATVWDWRARANPRDTGTRISWIEPEGLVARLHKEPKPIVVDVRGPDEFVGELGHIADASNIPLDELPRRVGELESVKAKEVILVCRTQMRSAEAAAALSTAGFRRVTVLRGGMLEWARRELPAEAGGASSREGQK